MGGPSADALNVEGLTMRPGGPCGNTRRWDVSCTGGTTGPFTPKSTHMMDNQTSPAQWVEQAEAQAYASLVAHGNAGLQPWQHITVVEVQGASVFVAPAFSGNLLLNRALGVGVSQPFDASELPELERPYREADLTGLAIELSPAARPHDLDRAVLARGYRAFKHTSMLARDTRTLEASPSGLEVRQAHMHEGSAFANFCCNIFGYRTPFPELLKGSFDSPDWQHWVAMEGSRMAAAAMTHLVGDRAWIGWVCTDPKDRGRGLQREVTACQLSAARAQGVKQVSLEAATGSKLKPGASLRNYQRMGFEVIHERRVYVLKMR